MHTQRTLHTRRSLATAALMLATFSASALHAQWTGTGNQRASGDIDADGNLGWGRTPSTPSAVAGKLRYFQSVSSPFAPPQLAFDATEADAAFTWNDDAEDVDRSFKMRLDQNNILSLYPTAGGEPSISLTPDSGAIKLGGTAPGLYTLTGGGVLQIDGSGRPYFATKPIFQAGVDFGSGGTLDSAKVQYLQGMLTNLGYDPNAGTYTDVTKLYNTPNLTITRTVYANGYIHWIGYCTGSVKLGSSTYDESNGRFFVVKANPNGTPVWVKQIQVAGGTINQETIAVNSAGTVVIGGLVVGSTTNLGAQNFSHSGTGYSTDAYVLVFNSSGTPQWSRVLSSNNFDKVSCADIDSSGNVVVVGTFDGVSMTHATGTIAGQGGDSDGFVVKYNSSGAQQWARAVGGASADSVPSVKFLSTGNIVLGGEGGTTTNMAPHNVTASGFSDAWVAGLSGSDGAVQWSRPIGGSSGDNFKDLAVSGSGTIYAATLLRGTTTTLGSYNRTSAGDTDGLVTALNSSGTVQWATVMGGTGSDSLSRLVLESGGSLVAATTNTSATTNLGSYNFAAGGAVIVLNSSGTVTSSQVIGAPGQVGILEAVPLGALSSGLALRGSSMSNALIGDTRVAAGYFLVTVPGASISTPALPSTSALAWNGGTATLPSGVALGGKSFAEGENSTAIGEGAAMGRNSFATGSGRATGQISTALGNGTQATGDFSTAIGIYSSALAQGSIAIGNNATASGSNAIALGEVTTASGYASLAAGSGATASGSLAIALGEWTLAEGYSSTSMGGWGISKGSYSTTLGSGNIATGEISLAAGSGTLADAYVSTTFGQFNIGGGTPASWVETDPLFEIGNSTSGSARSNALTTRKNGRTTLTNKAWKTLAPADALDDPAATDDDGGDALIVEGHTRLKGKVIIEPQGDLSMGEFTGGENP